MFKYCFLFDQTVFKRSNQSLKNLNASYSQFTLEKAFLILKKVVIIYSQLCRNIFSMLEKLSHFHRSHQCSSFFYQTNKAF